jgi:hypothetical protein
MLSEYDFELDYERVTGCEAMCSDARATLSSLT